MRKGKLASAEAIQYPTSQSHSEDQVARNRPPRPVGGSDSGRWAWERQDTGPQEVSSAS